MAAELLATTYVEGKKEDKIPTECNHGMGLLHLTPFLGPANAE